jgi:hypothetical protein
MLKILSYEVEKKLNLEFNQPLAPIRRNSTNLITRHGKSVYIKKFLDDIRNIIFKKYISKDGGGLLYAIDLLPMKIKK